MVMVFGLVWLSETINLETTVRVLHSPIRDPIRHTKAFASPTAETQKQQQQQERQLQWFVVSTKAKYQQQSQPPALHPR
ncbi:hypothetical protein DFQ26_000447 [Actinomortierella ambigua]|nr:hypothetical protein DFQ26_000447 [Actinomortierella ambigua]